MTERHLIWSFYLFLSASYFGREKLRERQISQLPLKYLIIIDNVWGEDIGDKHFNLHINCLLRGLRNREGYLSERRCSECTYRTCVYHIEGQVFPGAK